ncbi:S-layer homology domain-containing protein [Desertifilum sp. FACHB-1129]|uniref:S-layer homology domain-containing protein n=1 Tax=Desertifilum TaxID=1185872 RepID=UPI001686D1AC|nr:MULTISPECIES: S-layer homology domain-containing protein [Desertifilum]MBD2313738.1 S-layer homology domain-containing protein [Desertifilum sp. FACHB-1129]MBD2324552.1 S-layer homology domain-containing protein [Desertifilum sp. FACHB-866]MBD2334566.1 S-layer homology domain-containing protein [Desertifilum sp. FACHB-868]MDA0209995.1 S-layer homology domain-containing protein [Cyanobacteria bacterium FC1]
MIRRIVSLTSLILLFQGLPAFSQTLPRTQENLDPIAQVTAANFMSNFPDGNFYPERTISRAELASILVRVFRLDVRQPTRTETLTLTDVPTTHWAYNDIRTAIQTGMMTGYREGQFFPNQRVTRAEAFSIIAQGYGVFQFPDENIRNLLSRYPDSNDIPSWARKSMATALYEGFVNTDSNSRIRPQDPMTRGDMAYALSQYLARQERPATIPWNDDANVSSFLP